MYGQYVTAANVGSVSHTILGTETMFAILLDGLAAYLLDKFVRRWILIIPLAVISGMVSAFISSYMLHLYDSSMWTAETAAERGIVGAFYHPLFVLFFVWLWRRHKSSSTDDGGHSINRLGDVGPVVADQGDSRIANSSKVQENRLAPIFAADEEWEILSKYDTLVSAAVDVVRVHGEAAIEELWKAHRVINDKSQLARIASKIDEEYRALADAQVARVAKQKEEGSPEFLMKKYGIESAGGRFYFGEFVYDNLDKAIQYAETVEFRKQLKRAKELAVDKLCVHCGGPVRTFFSGSVTMHGPLHNKCSTAFYNSKRDRAED